jgi:hypothetical protein
LNHGESTEEGRRSEGAREEAPAKQSGPSHGDRLDKLEKDHAALLDVARANGWSLPE